MTIEKGMLRNMVSAKTSFNNDVDLVVDFRQGQVAVDRGEVYGAVQALCLCEQPAVESQPVEIEAKAQLEHDQADRQVDQRAQVEQHVVDDQAERVRPERGPRSAKVGGLCRS